MNKLLLFVCVVFISVTSYSQSDEGEIVVSEESLQRLADKLYQLKLKYNTSTSSTKDIQLNKSSDSLIYIINQLNQNQSNSANTTQNALTDEVLERLYSIEEQLKQLNITKNEKAQFKTDTVFLSQEEQNKEISEIAKENDTYAEEVLSELEALRNELANAKNEASSKKPKEKEKKKSIFEKAKDNDLAILAAMQIEQRQAIKKSDAKIDSLLTLVSQLQTDSIVENVSFDENKKTISDHTTDFESLKNQIYLLNAKLDRILKDQIENEAKQKVAAAQVIDTVFVEKTEVVDAALSAYEARKKEYSNFFEQVYFDNNSTQIDNSYVNLISTLVEKLNKEPKIDVAIEGFASKTGNATYNEKISMQRALALKKKLQNKGINANRILTDYKGIDNDATTLAEARRIDIRFVVRR